MKAMNMIKLMMLSLGAVIVLAGLELRAEADGTSVYVTSRTGMRTKSFGNEDYELYWATSSETDNHFNARSVYDETNNKLYVAKYDPTDPDGQGRIDIYRGVADSGGAAGVKLGTVASNPTTNQMNRPIGITINEGYLFWSNTACNGPDSDPCDDTIGYKKLSSPWTIGYIDLNGSNGLPKCGQPLEIRGSSTFHLVVVACFTQVFAIRTNASNWGTVERWGGSSNWDKDPIVSGVSFTDTEVVASTESVRLNGQAKQAGLYYFDPDRLHTNTYGTLLDKLVLKNGKTLCTKNNGNAVSCSDATRISCDPTSERCAVTSKTNDGFKLRGTIYMIDNVNGTRMQTGYRNVFRDDGCTDPQGLLLDGDTLAVACQGTVSYGPEVTSDGAFALYDVSNPESISLIGSAIVEYPGAMNIAHYVP